MNMGTQAFAGVATLVALTFLLLAMAACANVEQPAYVAGEPADIAPVNEPAVPEFHGAAIGNDLLRSRLTSEG